MPARTRRSISAEQSELLRQIPSVDELMAQPRLVELSKQVDRNLVVEVARTVLDDLRVRITGQVATAVLAEISPVACDPALLEERITALVERILARSLLPVINATGVILHTNLGRAPLPESVVEEFRLADYENAINERTRLLLRVHPSNFKVTGFTDKPSLEELVALSRRVSIPLVEDLGSGCLVDLAEHGIMEPTVRQSIEAGVGIVTFSGDKLLGGPQAGIIAGKNDLISRVRRHPLFRALRVDKLTIAALEATLGAYLRAAWEEIPAMRMICMTPQELKRRAENFVRELRPELPLDEVEIEIVDGASLAGGGCAPTQW